MVHVQCKAYYQSCEVRTLIAHTDKKYTVDIQKG